jgi:glycosyltransferase involved in cell wall biosynthesis
MDFPDNASKELIIEGENGFVCRNDNDLIQKIEYLCYEANYIKISRKSLEAASKYDMALIENQIREIYLNVSGNC